MAKHPSHDRTFQPSGDSSSSYGDGGFYFTQPVGAGGGYADGGFFFTQPVGAGGGYAGPSRAARRASGFVHPAYAGAGGYGVAPKVGAVNLKNIKVTGLKATPSVTGTGASASAKTGTGIADKPATKKAAATASAATIKAFEDAYVLLGEKQFWRDYWNAAKTAAGSNFSTQSQTEKKGWDDAYTAASRAATSAEQALLAGMPPFPVLTSGVAAGMATGPEAEALRAYKNALIEKGMLNQAFRKVSGSKRSPSQPLIDAILRDIRDPMMKTLFTSTSKGTTPWDLRSGAKLDSFMAAMRGYIINDPQSEWSDAQGNWGTKWWAYVKNPSLPGDVGGSPLYTKTGSPAIDAVVAGLVATGVVNAGDRVTYAAISKYAINTGTTFDNDFVSNGDRDKVTKSYVSWRMLKKFFTDANKNAIKSARTPWDTKKAANPQTLSSAKANWENARKTFVETARTAEQLTIEQQNNALTAKNKATETEGAFDKTRDFATAALSARQGAEGAALVSDVAATQQYAAAADAAAKDARAQSDLALRLAQEVTSLVSRAGGLAVVEKERADAASVAAERSAGEARESADAATAQVAVAQSGLAVKQAEDEAKRAAEAKAAQDAAVADANAKAQGAQAAADAAKAAADRAAAGVANGTVSAADAEAARRKYEELQSMAAAEAAKAGAEQAKADLAKAEAERIEALAAAERNKKDEITRDVFTPGEQEPGRLQKPQMVSGDLAPSSSEGFLTKYKTPILVTVLLGGAALAWHLTRNR
jgi:hypothetical protein